MKVAARGRRATLLGSLAAVWCCVAAGAQDDGAAPRAPGIQRRIPPAGVAPEAADRQRLQQRLDALGEQLQSLSTRPGDSLVARAPDLLADVDVLLKAVVFALEHDEFYAKGTADVRKADGLLDLAEQRLQALARGSAPWATHRGLVVRGYYSSVDGSPQPYGLEIPEKAPLDRPAPLLVFLHGRGDKVTDLHFLDQRRKQPGKVALDGALVLHPFGRQCIGFKSAGETDVLDAIADVARRYAIDPQRIVLMGFSMGGAGAWHLGAHYADRWVAVSPGAGFAETALYNRLTPEAYPPEYEQRLWGVYDAPAYVRNLFNTTVVAYSGELDKQIQAARVMEQAYREEGRQLRHLIGPGVGHEYQPETLEQLRRELQAAVAAGRDDQPDAVSLQTRTLRYSRMHWVEALRLQRHWVDSRIDARHEGGRLVVSTSNIRRMRLSPPDEPAVWEVDGQRLELTTAAGPATTLELQDGRWQVLAEKPDPATMAWEKQPGLQGPLDDAFLDAFLVVVPEGPCRHPQVDSWVRAELDHLRSRWKALFRGVLPEKPASDVTADDMRDKHLVLWGDPQANPLTARWLRDLGDRCPLVWDERQVRLGEVVGAAEDHVPLLIFPSPWSGGAPRYVVLNSGPTFREADDRTNSLQNPKLPDWAILRAESPDERRAGEVLGAGFFDEFWQFDPESTWR